MHIPDGFLDAKTAVAAGVLSAAALAVALRRVKRELPPRRVPLLGLASAFIFATQMLNFPVAGGTSGHLIGAVLAVALLGPLAAVVVMTSVLVLQCFLFQDGGLTALGANVFNMAVVATAVGGLVYAGVRRLAGPSLRVRLLATAFAAWCSTVAAAVACAGELATSGTVAWHVALVAMGGVHMLIGIGEAVITTLVVAAIARLRPELLDAPTATGAPAGRVGGLVLTGVLVSVGLAAFVAPFACGWPDGLERVAQSLGLERRAAEQPVLPAPLPDYTVPAVASEGLSASIAGVVGTVVAFLGAWCLAYVLTRRPRLGDGAGPAVPS